jgi:hypothetical protein
VTAYNMLTGLRVAVHLVSSTNIDV